MGIRRDPSSLLQAKIEKYRVKFGNPQSNFIGTDEELLLLFKAEEAYGLGSPIMTDIEFDELVKKTGYEQSLRVPTSSSGRGWKKMAAPLVSLRSTTDVNAIRDFLAGFSDGTHFYVEPKLDGMTFNAVYKLDGDEYVIDTITSRGDGRFGLELHEDTLKGVKTTGLPKSFEASVVKLIPGLDNDGTITVRGETVVRITEDNATKLHRSVAAGMMNRKVGYLAQYFDEWAALTEQTEVTIDPVVARGDGVPLKRGATYEASNSDLYDASEIGAFRGEKQVFIFENEELHEGLTAAVNRINELCFVSFSVVINESNVSAYHILGILKDYGFLPVFEVNDAFVGQADDVIKFIETVDTSAWEFPNDGLVIKPTHSNKDTQGLVPRVKAGKIVYPHHPVDQIAFKFMPEKLEVKIAEIIETETKLGNITYSAVLDKHYVTESGAVVNRVNLHNKDWLAARPWIHVGATVKLIMSRKIIPVILED